MSETVIRRGRVKTPSPDFTFDPVAHAYRLGSRVLPSITQILTDRGYIDKTYYDTSAGRLARVRGTHVHQAIHFLNKGTLDWGKLPDAYFGHVTAYQKLFAYFQIELETFEQPMYHPTLFFAGTPDIVCRIFKKYPAIIEIKTGPVLGWVALQTIAQEMLVRAWEKNPARRRRFGVTLNADGTYQKPVEFTNFMLDELTFKSNNVSMQHRALYGARF